jgi:hypothetical protein
MTERAPAQAAGQHGTELTRFNALRHGLLSRYTVLPWEDADEYHGLLQALVAEHQPQGPTEGHLVEELAGIMWRKRRLRLAEAATHRQGLQKALSPYRETGKAALAHLSADGTVEQTAEAVRTTATENDEDRADLIADEAVTRRALELLGSSRNDAYEAALQALREDTQEWWADEMARAPDELDDGEEPAQADCESLRRFIEVKVLQWFETRRKELTNRPLIRDQAFGEALDPDKLEKLGRHEVHLDRKLERTLSMLLRLKDLRGMAADR